MGPRETDEQAYGAGAFVSRRTVGFCGGAVVFASALLIGGGLNRAEQMASMHETAAATQQAPQTEVAPARDADAPAERDERSGQDQAVAPAGAAGSADGGESSNKLTPGVAGVPSGPLSQDPSVEQPAPNLAPTLVPQLRSLVEAHYQKLSGYLERVRAMIESFERDWANPSLDVRKRCSVASRRWRLGSVVRPVCRGAVGTPQRDLGARRGGHGERPKQKLGRIPANL